MNNLITHFNSILDESHPDIEMLSSFFEKRVVYTGEIILKPGEKVNTAWNVAQGVLRAYYYQEEGKHTWKNLNEITVREVTPWIVPAPGFLTDIHGFLLDRPSKVYIQAMEYCELYCLSQKNYKALQVKMPSFASLIFERSLIMADSRVRLLHLRKPIDRLRKIEKVYPGISNRISVNVMASYLNIDPSTLSKLRGKKDFFA